MFSRALPCDQIARLRDEAKRIATALGEARECDVFKENAEAGPLSCDPPPEGAAALLAAVERRRAAAYAQALGLVSGPETTLFVLRVQRFLAGHAWRNSQPGAELPLLARPAKEFATAALDRLHKRARKRARDLAGLPDEERHSLRIALKNLRYAAEFFGPLFGHRNRHREFLGHVSALQDILGAHNDMATARQFTGRLAIAADSGARFASGFILGWQHRGAIAAETKLLKTWKAFSAAEPFWR